MKIKTKLITGFSLLITILMATIMVVLSQIVKDRIEINLNEQLTATTKAASLQVQTFINSTFKNYIHGVADQSNKMIRTFSENDYSMDMLSNCLNNQKIGENGYFTIETSSGKLVTHPDPAKIGTRSTETIDNPTGSSDDMFVRDEANGKLRIRYRTYYQPLDWYITVVAFESELSGLIDMVSLREQILSIKVGQEGYSSILTKNNTMVVHPFLAQGTDLSDIQDADGAYLFQEIIDEKEGMKIYKWSEDDGSVRDKFASFTSIDSMGWIILITGYNDDLFAILKTINSVLLVLSFISLGLILVAVYFFSSIVVKPIVYTTNLLKDISEGEGDLSKKLIIKSRDETGLMAGYFNNFTSKLSTLINNVKESSTQSVHVKEDLSSSFVETVSSLTQIDSNLQNINSQMLQMKDKVNNSTEAVEQIDSSIIILDSQIQEQSGAVEESTASVTEMVASLKSVSEIVAKKREAAKELVRTSRSGGEQIELTNKTFEQEISAKIGEISEMTTIISNIASQTNLLSMNAAIEAAHAGDSGRGFAVVADEIRKLAESSTTNSKRISDVIKSIVHHIEKTGEYVRNTAEMFTTIETEVGDLDTSLAEILNASQELSSGGEEVLSAMVILSDISVNVTAKSNGIKKNSSIVSGSIGEVSNISLEVTNSINEASSGISEINKNMQSSQNLVIELGEATDKVNGEIGQFKTD